MPGFFARGRLAFKGCSRAEVLGVCGDGAVVNSGAILQGLFTEGLVGAAQEADGREQGRG